MMRVTKSGGGIHIKCPDYSSTFEGHYLIPWFPFLPKKLAKLYLRLIKKPIYGLDTLKYTSRNNLIKRIHRICKENINWKVKIIDVKKMKVELFLRKKKIPRLGGMTYLAILCLEYLRTLFRREISCDLFILIKNTLQIILRKIFFNFGKLFRS